MTTHLNILEMSYIKLHIILHTFIKKLVMDYEIFYFLF